MGSAPMARLSLRVIPLTVASLALPAAARADPYHVLSVGPFGGLLGGGGALQLGGGVEASLLRLEGPMHRNAFLVGGVAQLGGFARNGDATLYGMLGGEVAYGGVGIEAGAYAQSAGGGYGSSLGARLGAYLSLGVLWVSGGVHVPVVQSSAAMELGVQGYFIGGFKYPLTLGGESPYSGLFNFSFGRGRPLVYGGAPVVAERASGPAWVDDLSPEVNSLDAATREALASAWLDDALAEHASVAAFTRVAMQLLAVGAPPELLEDAHRAALDEVRHAKLCFTLASLYGARWEAPGPLSPDAIRHAVCDRPTLAREALLEGCLGEGVAAAIARASCEAVEDPDVKRVLEVIAGDEARHADLAWRILAWCLDTGGAPAADAVADALRALAAASFSLDLPRGVDAGAWVACGRMEPARAEALHDAVSRAVAERAWRHPAMAGRVSAISPRRAAPRSRRERGS